MLQDREFVEMDVPYNGAPKRPGSPSPLTSPAHSTASRSRLLLSCCRRCYPQRYQVRGRRILTSTTSISEGPPSSSSHLHQSQTATGHQSHSQYHSQIVDPTTVPNVAFNVPGDVEQNQSSSSPYNETRVWGEAHYILKKWKPYLLKLSISIKIWDSFAPKTFAKQQYFLSQIYIYWVFFFCRKVVRIL